MTLSLLFFYVLIHQVKAEKISGDYPAPYLLEKTSSGRIEVHRKLKILKDGIYNHNRKLVIPTSPGGRIQLISNNETQTQMYFACSTPYSTWIATYSGKLRNIDVSNKNGQFIYTGGIPLDKYGEKIFADYSQKIELEKDGKIKFTISTKLQKKEATFYKCWGFMLELPLIPLGSKKRE